MASQADALRIAQVTSKATTPRRGRKLIGIVADWFRKGQLGASRNTEMARYTGARV